MQEFITDIIWLTISIIGAFAIVYSLVRLAAIAWHRTKREYDPRPFNDGEFPNRQNDEEQ